MELSNGSVFGFVASRIAALAGMTDTELARVLAAPDDVHVPVAAFDWGRSTATFVVALDGRPAFVRVLRDCGLQTVIGAVIAEWTRPFARWALGELTAAP